MPRLLVLAAACLLAGATVVHSGGAAARGKKPAPPPAVAVAPNGSDSTCRRGDLGHPCASFDAAFHRARCGDVVEVAAGDYGVQEFHGADRTCSAYVTFRPAAGATAAITNPTGGDGACSASGEADCVALWIDGGTSWLKLSGLAIKGDFSVIDADHVAFVNDTGGGGLVRDTTSFAVTGGSYGPCQSPHVTPHTTYCASNWTFDGDGRTTAVLRNLTIHDFTLGGGDHFECVRVYRVATLVVSGARITNCMIYGITLQYGGVPSHVVVENSWFGPTLTGDGQQRGSSVEFSSEGVPFENTTIRHNSFAPGEGITAESGTFGPNVAAANNILGAGGDACIPEIVYTDNLSLGAPCPGDSNTAAVPFGYVLSGARLRPDGARANAVRKAFALAQRPKASLAGVVKALRKARWPAPGGWRVNRLDAILGNSVYRGGLYGPPGANPPLVTAHRWATACRRVDCSGK
jgi:hypothetical protein